METKNLQSDYVRKINELLKPSSSCRFTALDLYAGCGGLALGFESSGFRTIGMEVNSDCVVTYNNNLSGKCAEIYILESSDFPKCDIVIGGPPCQPFSVGGHQRGKNDERNGFPAYIGCVEKTLPRLFLIENVRGLLYKNFEYYRHIIKSLEFLGYIVETKLINAVHYGVPQNRERIFIVGHKSEFKFPDEELYKVTAGDAIQDILDEGNNAKNARWLTPNMDLYIAKYERASKCITPRDLHLDRPARTLTCRNLAGATGDMHRVCVGVEKRRMISVRESARLQSFPDSFIFSGSTASQFKQIGNSVAPLLAYKLANCVIETLNKKDLTKNEIQKINTQREQISH